MKHSVIKQRAMIFVGFAIFLIASLYVLSRGAAQTATAPTGPAAIAAGPEGMWIVQGGTVYVCQPGVRSGVEPGAPICGRATRLAPLVTR